MNCDDGYTLIGTNRETEEVRTDINSLWLKCNEKIGFRWSFTMDETPDIHLPIPNRKIKITCQQIGKKN